MPVKNKPKVSVSVILPTYNERENIIVLIPQIEKSFLRFKDYVLSEILVVDDYSPDQTSSACFKLNKKYKNISVHLKKREGIGAALRLGYNLAKGDIIVSMDSDLSFSVSDIIKLLDKLDEGHDLVLGCRHSAKGGYETIELSTKIKGFISSIGNKIIPLIVGINIHDFSGNFRAIRKKTWRAIKTKDNTNSMLLEMIVKTHRNGYKIAEVPVIFKERRFGKSKLNLYKEAFRFIYKLFIYSMRG